MTSRAEQNSKLSDLLPKLNDKETQELVDFLENYIQETKTDSAYPIRSYFLVNPFVID